MTNPATLNATKIDVPAKVDDPKVDYPKLDYAVMRRTLVDLVHYYVHPDGVEYTWLG